MTVRTILTWPEPSLRNHSEPVEDMEQAKEIASDLRDTLIASFGLGIAASQVGILKRIVVVKGEELDSFEEDQELPGYKVFVNPEISVEKSNSLVNSQEACLSVPGISAQIQRNSNVFVTYKDLNGRVLESSVSGRDACILQHEFDHLDGKLFIDRLSQLRKKMVVSKLKKRVIDVKKITRNDEDAKKRKIKAKRAKLRAERKKRKKNRR